MNYTDTKDILHKIEGLTGKEVNKSKQLHGDNQLVQNKKHSFFKELLRNFGDPIIKILLIALGVNIIIMIRDFVWYEAAGIAAAILISTFVSTISEYGSESAFEKLQQDALKTKCRVKRREGLVELSVSDVVVGDYILLQAGDRIPADGIVIAGSLYIDQSPLNGESKEIFKTAVSDRNTDIQFDFHNKHSLFRGCVVCSGEAVMLVKGVGLSTSYGKLALEIQEESRESPLKHRLGVLAGLISKFGYIGAALVAVADLFHSIILQNSFVLSAIIESLTTPKEILEYFIHAATLAISVIVVAIPEGLPLMITVVLSSNMKRMLKDNVLVRKLVGIETSGSINILFSDKTGTITKGNLKVTAFMDAFGKVHNKFSDISKTELGRILKCSLVYNSGAVYTGKKGKIYSIGGNSTEKALLDYVAADNIKFHNISVISSLPFNSVNKYSCARVKGDFNGTLIKGAPEILLPECSWYYNEKGIKTRLTNLNHLKNKMDEMSSKATRLLAVAVSETEVSHKDDMKNLILVGVIGIRDEVRKEAVAAIHQVMNAGVQVIMITGDNKDTAAAIAKEVGLLEKNADGQIITSEQMEKLSDTQLKEKIPYLRVVARALPSDKSRLIKAAQELGLVTGMTGDGINDAPALKMADVGFAMGSGTEVAKEAGDIIILDDNFKSISNAILYGRTIFKSIRKFIVFQLTINMCAVGISIIGPFIGINSPITVLQMLWVNMIMDTLAGLAFAGEAPLKEYMEERPKKRNEPIINKYMINQILISGAYITTLCLLFLLLPGIKNMYQYEKGNEIFMTAFFALFIFASVFNSFNARTTRLRPLAHIQKNKAFIIIMAMVSIIQIAIIYFGGTILRTTGLNFKQFQFVIVLAFTVIPFDIIRKIIVGSKFRKEGI